MKGGVFTLPQVAEKAGAEYRTLHSWVERGMVRPSVKRSKGTGHVQLFSERDAELICALAELRRRGLDIEALAVVAATLQTRRTSTCPICHGAIELGGLQPNPDKEEAS